MVGNYGIVKWFDDKKGYGFIAPENGSKDIFVHYSGIVCDGFKTIQKDQRVSFDVVEGKKGLEARNVDVVKFDYSK